MRKFFAFLVLLAIMFTSGNIYSQSDTYQEKTNIVALDNDVGQDLAELDMEIYKPMDVLPENNKTEINFYIYGRSTDYRNGLYFTNNNYTNSLQCPNYSNLNVQVLNTSTETTGNSMDRIPFYQLE